MVFLSVETRALAGPENSLELKDHIGFCERAKAAVCAVLLHAAITAALTQLCNSNSS